ncbi:MAG: gliding motility protein GldN [Prevotellaceae bacterium]|jgi:gliding motility associated protien GldN|nr:gliding motility protein GldN [Prevotellaceae bacterium]
MKNFKFYLPLIALILAIGSVQAQEQLSQEQLSQEQLSQDSTQMFFDDNGSFTQIRVTSEDVATKIITLNPRIDDVVWSKTVLRVIDLREMQNRPLYYPNEDLEEIMPKNLFAIIFSHFLDGTLTTYKSKINYAQTYCPTFTPQNVKDVEEFLDEYNLRYYSDSNWARVNYLTQGVVKYYAKVVTYFDKSSSIFRTEVIALAPLFDKNYNRAMSNDDVETSVFFWVPYKHLRPFLQEEFIKMNGRNTIPLIDFDNFFVGGYYSSYVIKDYDLTSQDVDLKANDDPIEIRKRQDRIEAEILDFDQDLWSY